MFKKTKTIFDYVEEHEPYNEIDELIKPKYLPNLVSPEHKELEEYIDEYWELLHDLVKDFINSYAILYGKLAERASEAIESVDSARRQLVFEQSNVQELSDQVRELKGQLQNEIVVRRDLESRLTDTHETLKAQYEQEKKSLEILASANIREGMSLDEILKSVQSNLGDSEEVKRLHKKVSELEDRLIKEREENERVQEELSMSFMNKITKYDEMIQTLKARLGDD